MGERRGGGLPRAWNLNVVRFCWWWWVYAFVILFVPKTTFKFTFEGCYRPPPKHHPTSTPFASICVGVGRCAGLGVLTLRRKKRKMEKGSKLANIESEILSRIFIKMSHWLIFKWNASKLSKDENCILWEVSAFSLSVNTSERQEVDSENKSFLAEVVVTVPEYRNKRHRS